MQYFIRALTAGLLHASRCAPGSILTLRVARRVAPEGRTLVWLNRGWLGGFRAARRRPARAVAASRFQGSTMP